MVRVLVSDSIAQNGVDLLREHAEVDVKTTLSVPELLAIIGEYDGLVVRSKTKVTREVIEAGPRLRVIGRAGVGVDNIDLEAATRRGILVVNAPTANNVAAAEHSVAMMLALARNIPQANACLQGGHWEPSKFMGVEVRHKVLGIVGLGNIGKEVAKRAQGLDMQTIAYDPYVPADRAEKLHVSLASLDEVLASADFVTIHLPVTEATRGLIGKRELSLMKSTARLINCARGGIVDEEALRAAVDEGRIAGAAVDVFSKEPATENVLFCSDKIIVTPHLGASTKEAQINVATDVAEEIIAFLGGQPVRYAVNAPAIPAEAMGVLSPYMDLAEKLGLLYTQLAHGSLKAIEAVYSGELNEYDTTPLKAALVKGLLSSISEETVNLVNAGIIAKSRGLSVTELKSAASGDYANMITMHVTTTEGTSTLAGTVIGGVPHIVRLDHYRVDIVPNEKYILLTQHQDRPGVIGAVGTILGRADVNISYMQVGRVVARGEALMVLGLDDPVPSACRDEILSVGGVDWVKVARL